MASLRLNLFGAYRLSMDGIPLHIESDKARGLLAYLAIERDQPHTREKLVGIFWPEHDEVHARGSLSHALYQLRSTLGDRSADSKQNPYLLVNTQTVQLNPQCDLETDVTTFSRLVAAMRTHAHHRYIACEECLENGQQAARLYTGDFLDGFYMPKSMAFEEWVTFSREALRLEVMGVLEGLVMALKQQGEHEHALAYARRMVTLDELSEAGNVHVMELLALVNRREEALAHYASFRQIMAIQLGAEPGQESKMLYQRLHNEQAGTEPGYLHTSLTPFIGRKQELIDLWGWLVDPGRRLICILGTGGSGKTRLALEAARRQRYHFADGVYFVPLSALGKGSSLLAAVAERLGFTFRDKGEHQQQLLDFLRNKKLLLVLDSFETVTENAGLVAEILAASEGSKLLVTSRVRLELSGEQVYPIKGMRFPPKDGKQVLDYSAVALFLEAARRVKPDFLPEDLDGIARICRLVEGMPLSLILAASWVGEYPTHEIAEQIERSLDFLAVEWADLPARQRSLRATYEYSWDMLSQQEQQTLMRLAVFRNPFSGQTAQQVAGASPQLLHTLVGKSLLASLAEGQYQMHDLVCQYSLEKLSHAEDGGEGLVRERHSEYFLGMAAGWSILLKGRAQNATLTQADRVIEDVKAAWESAARQGKVDRLINGLEGLCLYFELRARFKEGQSACQAAMEGVAGTDTPQACTVQAYLLIWQARFSRLLGELESAQQWREESQRLAERMGALGLDMRGLQAFTWLEEGEAILTADFKVAREHLERSVELYRQIADNWRLPAALADLGINLQHSGKYAEAVEVFSECIEIRRANGDQRGLAFALTWLAFNYSRTGPLEKCETLAYEAMAINQSIGDKASVANGLLWMTRLLVFQGKLEESFIPAEQCLPLLYDLGDRYNSTFAYMSLGVAKLLNGNYDQVEHYCRMALELGKVNGLGREIALCHWIMGTNALAQGEIQRAYELLNECVALYRRVGHQDELSWGLAWLANILTIRGESRAAMMAMVEALQIAVTTRAQYALGHSLGAMASILAREGRAVEAIEIYMLVLDDPLWKVSPWMEQVAGQYVSAASAGLPEEVVEAARQRGKQRDKLATAQELLEECKTRLETSRLQAD